MKPKKRVQKLFWVASEIRLSEQDVYDICRVQRTRLPLILSELVEQNFIRKDEEAKYCLNPRLLCSAETPSEEDGRGST